MIVHIEYSLFIFSLFFFEQIQSHTGKKKQIKETLEKTRSEHLICLFIFLIIHLINVALVHGHVWILV
jgi:hypothetical protein